MTEVTALDLHLLRRLADAAEAEQEAMRARGERGRLHCGEALSMHLMLQHQELLAAASQAQAPVIDALRPFARVAQLVDRHAGGVLFSLRLAGARSDYVQLTGPHFHTAAALVAAWDKGAGR